MRPRRDVRCDLVARFGPLTVGFAILPWGGSVSTRRRTDGWMERKKDGVGRAWACDAK